ncbi:PREDICTED: alpha-tocopherol transfer protein-like [Dinoponera quadriceps]|uniref:Alpha-tocopherol transfer protein-like n=1 Tax=Dinoponera quadriceps TaxID=609295 RepID=A0A6P3XZH4_DINQU|nr:PREDICTED: alpha-tocopherol transfer protein-like [Dinoponera quadriceps]
MATIKLVSYEDELKKNPELKKSDVEALREWCEKQPHLPKISDSMLALFLHSNYYRLEPTKACIEVYYTTRSHVPEFFNDRDIINNKELKRASQLTTCQILEKSTQEGYTIIYIQIIDSDPAQFLHNDAFKLLNMVIDLWLYMKGTCDGHVIVINMSNISFGHVSRLSPMGFKKFFYYLQEGLPVRLQGVHFINTFPIIDIILNMMKPFMKKQLMDMLRMHITNETLKKFIPLDVLPNEAGGKAGPILELHDRQMKKLIDYTAWFKEEETNSRVNEAFRPGKEKTAEDLFGVEGSFKKLEID